MVMRSHALMLMCCFADIEKYSRSRSDFQQFRFDVNRLSSLQPTMKKYVTLQCSTCKRTKDALINLTHYATDRCTITLGCEGRLSPTGYTSEGTSVLSVPPTGISNWYPRGSTLTSTATLQADALYDTGTGIKQQLVLAVSDAALGFTPGSQAVLTLNLIAEQQMAKDFRQYTFRKSGSVKVVNGVEDAQAKKVLRYNTTGVTPDMIEVYVDGVKRDHGTGPADYDLYDGTPGSAVPPNSVLFNNTVTGSSTQIDVIVTKASTITAAQLTFVRAADDEARDTIGAWEGIDAVTSPSVGRWSLFYCDVSVHSANLALDVQLRLDAAKPTVLVNVPGTPENVVTAAAILLSRSKLYTQLDRQRSKWVRTDRLVSNNEYLVVKLLNKVRTLLVTELTATDVFPVLQVIRFDAPSLQTANLIGNPEAAQLDNQIIIGPDA